MLRLATDELCQKLPRAFRATSAAALSGAQNSAASNFFPRFLHSTHFCLVKETETNCYPYLSHQRLNKAKVLSLLKI